MDRREELNDDEEALRLAMDSRLAQVWTSIPAIVTAVNLGAMTISAQPAIQGKVEDALGNVTNTNLPLLINVPICFPSAGGFTLTFPIAAGDEVLVVFGSRCIDSWWQSGGVGVAMEDRMHDLSDGFAVLAPKSQARKISNISSSNAQLRSDDGDTYLEITPSGQIKLSAATSITLDTPDVFISGRISNITGEYGGDYDATFSGTIRTTDDVISSVGTDDISLNDHIHSGVTTGGGNTGQPV